MGRLAAEEAGREQPAGAVGKLRLGRRRPQAFRGIAAGGREFLAGEGVEQPVAESDREVEVRKVGVAGEIGRAHVCTPVTNAQLVCRLLLDNQKYRNE